MRKSLTLLAVFFIAAITIAAAYSNSWIDGIFTGNGTLNTDIALPTWGANQNATVQIARNNTGGGGGQGSALDVYAGGGGYLERYWIDCAVDGGKCAVITIDYGGNLKMVTSLTVSGVVTDHNGRGQDLIPLLPTTDSYMIGVWSDISNGGNIYSAANQYATEGSSNAQTFVAMDGVAPRPNVRFAIDGISGALRWTNSTSNTFNGANWDTKFGRIDAGILGDPYTSLQTPHLDQPVGQKDVAGSIYIVAANTGTFTFNAPYTKAPICVASPTSLKRLTWWITSSPTGVTVNLSGVTTATFNYHCVGNPS